VFVPVAAPVGTSQVVVDKFSRHIEPVGSTPAEFAAV
jgi:hypothetical protein